MRAATHRLFSAALTCAPLAAQSVPVDLDVDADRDGKVEVTSGEDDDGEELWSTQKGAVMLFNNDDDDQDHVVDALDQTVNGPADGLDLAPLVLGGMPGLPVGWTGWLLVDGAAAPHVRIFRYGGGNWSHFDPRLSNPLSAAQLAQRALYGIEALDYAQSEQAKPGLWDGEVLVSLVVRDAGGAIQGHDEVRLRVAPFVLHSNLSKAERVFVVSKSNTQSFIGALQAPVAAGGGVLGLIDGIVQHPTYDIWVQDAMEFGYSSMPSRLGPRSIPSVLRAPRGMALDGWTHEHALGPNFGYVAKGSKRNNVGWIDWFGNLDCTPPLPGWPLGRIYTGYQGALTIHPDVLALLDAQRVQGPVLQIDTGWLLIGHVDEEICFVPSKVGSPYRMLVPSTVMTISILQGLAAAGKGQLAVFQGKSSQTTVQGLLGNTSLINYNVGLQTRIDLVRQQMISALTIAPADVIEVPALFSPYNAAQQAVGLMPNMVNSLVVGDRLISANPFGPVDGGVDQFAQPLVQALAPLGLQVDFVDNWYPYHEWLGEVHCGTNAVRIPSDTLWWTVP